MLHNEAMKLSEKQFGNWVIAARRNLFMPVNRSVPDVVQKRKNWNGLMSGFKASDLVFLDESGCNTDMTRRHAYSLGGSRAVDSAPRMKIIVVCEKTIRQKTWLLSGTLL